jgi:biopolymer transport protein ExbD/biopolymer transport protein TolR
MADNGKKVKAANVNSTINVTPMVDVMLVLLIIFMVITPMLQHGHSVDLAPTDNPKQMPDADKEDAVLVAISRDGKIFFGADQVMPDQLTDKVKDLISGRVDKTVYVKADRRAKYGNVAEVVDNVRAAGVDELGLLTEQRKPGSFAPEPGAAKK